MAAMCSGAAWPAGVLGQGWECGRITQDHKMQREVRGMCGRLEIIFREKRQAYGKVYNRFLSPGRLAGVAGECETVTDRWWAAGSVNRTEHSSSSSLLPVASVHYGRKGKFFPGLTEPAQRSATRSVAQRRLAGRRRADSGESATARSALDKGTSADGKAGHVRRRVGALPARDAGRVQTGSPRPGPAGPARDSEPPVPSTNGHRRRQAWSPVRPHHLVKS